MNGTMRLDDFRREFPPLGDVPEVETMGGLLAHLLGVVPSAGEAWHFAHRMGRTFGSKPAKSSRKAGRLASTVRQGKSAGDWKT